MRTSLLLLLALVAGCTGRAAGEGCANAGECAEGLRCVGTGRGDALCMRPCAPQATRLCSDGSVCLSSPNDGVVCWYGGRTPVGQPCSDSVACEPGTVCEGGACRQACSVGRDLPCAPGDRCLPASAPPPDPGEQDAGEIDAEVPLPGYCAPWLTRRAAPRPWLAGVASRATPRLDG